jgi:PAS domain S-box-containing protein
MRNDDADKHEAVSDFYNSLKFLAENTIAGIFVFQEDVFVYVNPAVEKYTGYSKDELLKMRFWDIVHPSMREVVKERGRKRQSGEMVDPTIYEIPYLTKDGEERWALVSFSNTVYNGKPAGAAIIVDITNMKKLEKELKEKEERYRNLWNEVNDILAIIDADGNILDVNAKACEVSGYAEEELRSMNIRDFLSQEDLFLALELIGDLIAGGSGKVVEIPVSTRKGTIVTEARAKTVMYGDKLAVQISARDITERKKAERKLKRYERFFRNAKDFLFILDKRGRVVDANPNLVKTLGYDLEEVLGRTTREAIYPPEYDSVKKFFLTALSGETVKGEFRAVTKDGKVLWVEVVEWPFFENGEIAGVEGILRDITERKEMEEKIRESEERYRRFFSENPIAITVIDEDGKIVEANEEFARLTGYTLEEIVGSHFSRFVAEEDISRVIHYHRERLSGGTAPVQYEYKLKRKDGEIRDIEIKIITLPDGKHLSCRIDITERKKLENELRESEEKFRKLAENSIVGVYIIQDGVIKYANPKFAEIIGYGVEEIIGKDPTCFVHPDDVELVRDKIKRRILGEETYAHYTFRALAKNGEVKLIQVFGSSAEIGGKPAVIGVLIDITEIMKLNRLLATINEVNKILIREKNAERLLKEVCNLFSSSEEISGLWIGLLEGSNLKPVAFSEKILAETLERGCIALQKSIERKESMLQDVTRCSNCSISEHLSHKFCAVFPMTHENKVYGSLVLCFDFKPIDNEIRLLQTLASDLALAIHSINLENQKRIAYEQIEKNIEHIATLVDELRNPLAIISGFTELYLEGDKSMRILEQIDRIEKLLDKLDEGWIVTEKVREFLRNY